MCNILWFFLAGLICFVASVPPVPIQSTYQVKTAEIDGSVVRYAIFDMDFDQDLYMPSNWICACLDSPSNCTAKNQSTLSTTQPYEEFAPNAWMTRELLWGETILLHIDVQPTAAVPCPHIDIYMNTDFGTPGFQVSNEFIPTRGNLIWQKVHYNQDRLRICNNDYRFSYGSYFISVSLTPPYIVNGRFSMMWKLTQADTCSADTALSPEPPTDPFATVLADGVPQLVTVWDYTFFEFQVPRRCFNFTVTVRKDTEYLVQTGEVDIFASFSIVNPDVYSSGTPEIFFYFDLESAIEGDDSLTILNYCADASASLPIRIYLGLSLNSAAEDFNASIVATTQYGFELTPLKSYGAQQAIHSLTTQIARLNCGPNLTDIYPCSYPPIDVENAYGNIYQKCFPMWVLPPISGILPIFPYNAPDQEFYNFTRFFYWNTNETVYPNASHLGNRLSFGLVLNFITEPTGEFSQWVASPEGTCEVSFFSKISNANFEPIVGISFDNSTGNGTMVFDATYNFTLIRPANCSAATALDLVTQRKGYLDTLRSTADFSVLRKTQFQLTMLHLSDEWIACTNYIEDFFNTVSASTVFPYQRHCDADYQSYEFQYDACCLPAVEEFGYVCCDSFNGTNPYDFYTGLNRSNNCSSPECVQILATNYLNYQSRFHGENSCDAQFLKAADIDTTFGTYVSFIYKCQTETLGTDLHGRECSGDFDCLWGASCTPTVYGFRCNNTQESVVQCFASSISPLIGQYMFNNWRLTSRFSPEEFYNQTVARYIANDCFGPDMFKYQTHWEYLPSFTACSDGCYDQMCFSYHQDCDIACGSPFCNRNWGKINGDQTACLQQNVCNWMDCSVAGLTDAECQAACMNSSLSSDVCIQCDTGGINCYEVDMALCSPRGNGTCFPTPNTTVDNFTQCLISGRSCAFDDATYDYLLSTNLYCDPYVGPGLQPIDYDDPSSYQQFCPVGVCDAYCDVGYFQTLNGGGGVCFGPREYDNVSDTTNCTYPGSDFMHAGCYIPIANESGCLAASPTFSWRFVYPNKSACEEIYSCFDSTLGYYTADNKSACLAKNDPAILCPVFTWVPTYRYLNVVNTAATAWLPYIYTNRNYGPVNSIAPVVNFTGFRNEVESAITIMISTSFSSHEACKFDVFSTLLQSLTCDCQGGTMCYQNSDPILIEFIACPYLNASASVDGLTIATSEYTIPPPDFCQKFSVILRPVNEFAVPYGARLSSEIFYRQRTNSYSIVYQIGLLQGQVLSDGYQIVYDGSVKVNASIRVCIAAIIDPVQLPVDSAFTQFAIGKYIESLSSVQVSTYDVTMHVNNVTNRTFVCGDVREPGVYFVTLTTSVFGEVKNSHIIQCSLATLLYFVGTLVAFYYTMCFLFYYTVNRLYFKCFLGFVILLFTLIRWIYWLIIAFGGFFTVSVASYILFEFPTFLFLVMFSCLVYLWADFQYRGMKLKQTKTGNEFTFLLYVFAAWSVLILLVMIVFVIVYYTLPSGVSQLPCVVPLPESSGAKANVSLAYVCVIAFFGILIAIVGLFVGSRFNQVMIEVRERAGMSSNKKKAKTIQIYFAIIVGVIFAICFISKSSIFIAFVVVQSAIFPIIVFAVLEMIPTFLLLWYIAPTKTPFNDLTASGLTSFSSSRGSQVSSKGSSSQGSVELSSSNDPPLPQVIDRASKKADASVGLSMNSQH